MTLVSLLVVLATFYNIVDYKKNFTIFKHCVLQNSFGIRFETKLEILGFMKFITKNTINLERNKLREEKLSFLADNYS